MIIYKCFFNASAFSSDRLLASFDGTITAPILDLESIRSVILEQEKNKNSTIDTIVFNSFSVLDVIEVSE